MSSFYQRLVDCKALMWALLGVFLLAFGSLGLTMCSDDSHRIAEVEKLRLATAEQTTALEIQRTQFATLESSSQEIQGSLDAAIAERDEKSGTLAAVATGLAAIGIAGVTADTEPPEAVSLVAEGFADVSSSRDELAMQLANAQAELDTTKSEFEGAKLQLEDMADSQALIADENGRVLKGMQVELDSMRGAIDDAELEADKLRKQLKTATNKTIEMESANSSLTGERDTAIAELEALRLQNGELLAQLDEAQSAPVTQAQGLMAPAPAAAPQPDITAQLEELRSTVLQSSQGSLLTLKQDYEGQIRGLEAELEAARSVSVAKEEENSAHLAALSSLKGALSVSEKNVEAGLEKEQDLLADIAELERRKAELEEEVGSLNLRNTALSEEAEKLGGDVQEMKVGLAGSQKERDALQIEIDRLNGALEVAEATADESSQRVSLLSSSSEEMSSEVEELRAQVAASQSTISTLESQLSDAVATSEQVAVLDGQIEDYDQQLATAISDADRLRDTMGTMDATIIDLNAERDALQVELDAALSQRASLLSETEALSANADKIAELETANALLLDQIGENKAAAELAAEDAGQQIDAAISDADRLRGTITTMEATIAELNDERDGLQAKLDAVQTERSSLLSQTEELGATVAEVDALQAQIDAATADADRLRGTIAEMDEQLVGADEQLAAITAERDAKSSEIASYQGEIASLKEAAAANETTLSEAKDSMSDLEAKLATANAEVGTIRASLQSRTTERDELQEKLDGLAGGNDALTAKIESLEADIAGREKMIGDMTARMGELSRERDGLLAQLAEGTEGSAALQARIAELEKQMKAAEAAAAEKASAMEADLAEVQGNADATSAQLEAAQAQVTDREAEIAKLRADIEAAQTELGAREETTGELNTRLIALTGDLAASREELESLRAAGAERATLLSSLEEDSATLEKELADAQQRSNDLRDLLGEQRDRNAELERDANAMRGRIGTLEAASARVTELDGTVTSLNGELNTLRLSNEQLEEELAAAPTPEAIAAYEERLNAANENITGLQESSASLQAQLDAARQAQGSLQAELDAAREAQGSLDAQASQLASLQSLLQASQARSEQLTQELEAARLVEQTAPSRVVNDALRDELIAAIGPNDINVNSDGSFSLSSSATFASGSANLSNEGRAVLDRVAIAMNNFLVTRPDARGKIVVEGHTDADPIATAVYPSNWTLSAARAANVVTYLQQLGVPADRLAAVGFAETQPIDAGSSREAFARNRRIQFDFLPE